MNKNRDLPIELRTAADQSSPVCPEALASRTLLSDAADEIERLRRLMEQQQEQGTQTSHR